MVRLLSVVAVLGLLGCSAPDSGAANAQTSAASDDTIVLDGAERPSVHPVSGLEVIGVTIYSGGKEIGFFTELAETPEAQARGLMFRTELDDFAAMLFPSDTPQPRSFWMKNTPLPLDIIFIGTDQRILNIAAMTTPYSLESVRSDGLTSAVLEIRGGRAEELGIKPGDRVEWQLPE